MGASSFYGKSRLRQVERCVLRLMAAVRKKLQGHAEDAFEVTLFASSVPDTVPKAGVRSTHVCMHAVLAMVISFQVSTCSRKVCYPPLCFFGYKQSLPMQMFPFQEPAFNWADARNSAGNLRCASLNNHSISHSSSMCIVGDLDKPGQHAVQYQSPVPSGRDFIPITLKA